MGGKGIRTGPLEWNLRVGADRIDYQESGNMPGYVRANVREARFFSECVYTELLDGVRSSATVTLVLFFKLPRLPHLSCHYFVHCS